ncbi:MAG: type II toxin-antitoxin system mRNA interferase toxin, RelE/StbE family [Rickettsiales bacterium]|nr:MAG: type II toxin-antitoxin system mRNA interferase toxin, RelE/StbE family [Rickettsiales bacterium]
MRQIEYSSAFKKDYRRESKGKHQKTIDAKFKYVISSLIEDKILAEKYRDHDLLGDWLGYRECHISPDLLLIYRKTGKDFIRLARIGSHSKLFKK